MKKGWVSFFTEGKDTPDIYHVYDPETFEQIAEHPEIADGFLEVLPQIREYIELYYKQGLDPVILHNISSNIIRVTSKEALEKRYDA